MQLGHGRGVVLEHYADKLSRALPRLLDGPKRLRLPTIEAAGFYWPPPIQADRALPRRLWDEFRRLVAE